MNLEKIISPHPVILPVAGQEQQVRQEPRRLEARRERQARRVVQRLQVRHSQEPVKPRRLRRPVAAAAAAAAVDSRRKRRNPLLNRFSSYGGASSLSPLSLRRLKPLRVSERPPRHGAPPPHGRILQPRGPRRDVVERPAREAAKRQPPVLPDQAEAGELLEPTDQRRVAPRLCPAPSKGRERTQTICVRACVRACMGPRGGDDERANGRAHERACLVHAYVQPFFRLGEKAGRSLKHQRILLLREENTALPTSPPT